MGSAGRRQVSFYLDENMDLRIVEALRKHGINVTTTAEVGLLGEKDDNVHLAKATELGCVVVTHDRDFGRINKEWLAQGKKHVGIVFIERSHPRPPGELIKKLVSIYETKTAEEMENLFQPI